MVFLQSYLVLQVEPSFGKDRKGLQTLCKLRSPNNTDQRRVKVRAAQGVREREPSANEDTDGVREVRLQQGTRGQRGVRELLSGITSIFNQLSRRLRKRTTPHAGKSTHFLTE